MNQYEILVNILDELRNEAPAAYRRYYPAPDEHEKLDNARSRTFIHLFLKVRYGLDEFNERENYITDDAGDGGIDAYYINREQKQILFIQSKFRTNRTNFETKEISPDEILCMDTWRILHGETKDENGIPYNDKILNMQKNIRGLEDVGRYSYCVVLLANLKRYRESELRRLTGGYPAEVFDFEKCYTDLVFPVVAGCCFQADEIRINLSLANKEGNDGRIGYSVETEYTGCKITVVFVPILEIAKIMYKYKNSILKYNPRCFLGLEDNNINPKIQRTVVEKRTNEIALYNNGITILSDDTHCNAQIGMKDRAQLIITNPQIINGGQTAFTLSQIYREHLEEPELFEGKEVLVKVITLFDGHRDEDARLHLIEELSRATNEQSQVHEADRRSNDRVQIYYQQKIYEDFGYFYDRKHGEFYDGIARRYISEDNMVDRSVFLRVAACMHDEASKARRTGDDVLFRTESFHELMAEDLSYRRYMYGYFCHQYLTELEKEYRNLSNNRYGTATYGNALRYGRYAVVSVAGRTYREEMEPEDCRRFARYYTKAVLKQWLAFERRISRYSHNKSYFYSEEVDGRIETVLDYDGYYKGKTLDQDLGRYPFRLETVAEAEAALALK